jgi:hypothetical protein
MTLCQLVKAIDDFNGKFGIGGVGDVFLLYGGVNQYARLLLPTHSLFETYQKDFLFYQQVLAQQPKDKNKIYSLHEPDVYVIAKGKDHKQYELGSMAARLLHSLRFLSR